MDEKDLVAMGLTKEQAKKVMEAVDGSYVSKTSFDEVSRENKTLKTSVSERDKQLEELKKSSGDNEELKKQIEELQKTNKEQQKAHETELKQLKLDNAIDTALVGAGAKNTKAVKSLLDIEALKLADDGSVTGLKEAIAAVQKSDSYLFADTKQQYKGFQPGSSDAKPGGKVDTSKMNYDELCAYLAENPDASLE